MTTNLTATFETRRDAEMVIERLVQEFGVGRASISARPDGDENSAGENTSGGDEAAADPSVDKRADAALEGRIRVTVDLEDAAASDVRRAFSEFGGEAPAR